VRVSSRRRTRKTNLVTVIEGTWYLGEGAKFDSAKLKGYPVGSFIVIPAGILILSQQRKAQSSFS
jgi:hypothetical protein